MSAIATAEPSIIVNAGDDVAVARAPVLTGAGLGAGGFVARADIPGGHTVALRTITKGEPVLKCGRTIGAATASIAAGDHVQPHDPGMRDGDVRHHFAADARPTPRPPEAERRTFQDYARRDGQAGIRIGIASSVNCSAS